MKPFNVVALPASPSRVVPAQVSFWERLLARPWLCVALMTLFGGGLRAYHLGGKSLWIDEAIIYWITQGKPAYVLGQNAFWNSAPPTYPLLLSLVSQQASSEAGLRVLSLWGGIASLPALYLLAQQLLPRAYALLVVLLATVSLNMVRYSQELREYSWTFALTCLLLAAFIKADRAPSKRAIWLLLFVCWSGLLLQYGFFVLLLGLNMVWAWRALSKRTGLSASVWLRVQIACALVAPLLYELAAKRQLQPDAYGTASAGNYLRLAMWNGHWSSLLSFTVIRTLFTFRFAFPSWKFLLPILGLLALALLLRQAKPNASEVDGHAVGVAVNGGHEHDNAALTLALWGATTGAVWLLALAGRYPFNGGRQNMFLMPMIYVLGGWAVLWLSRLRWRRVLVPVAVGLGLSGLMETVSYLRGPGDEPMRDLVGALGTRRQPGERLWMTRSSQPIYTFYVRAYDPLTTVEDRPGVPGSALPPRAQDDARARAKTYDGYGRALPWRALQDELRTPGRVWFLFSHWDTDASRLEVVRRARVVRPNVKLVVQRGKNGFLYLAE